VGVGFAAGPRACGGVEKNIGGRAKKHSSHTQTA
jgi:hypothetical protein